METLFTRFVFLQLINCCTCFTCMHKKLVIFSPNITSSFRSACFSHSPWVDLGPLAQISHSTACITQSGSSRPLLWLLELCRAYPGLAPTVHCTVLGANLPAWPRRLCNAQSLRGTSPNWTAQFQSSSFHTDCWDYAMRSSQHQSVTLVR